MTNRREFLKSAAIGVPLIVAGQGFSQKKSGEIYVKPVVVSTWDSGIRANAEAWKVLAN